METNPSDGNAGFIGTLEIQIIETPKQSTKTTELDCAIKCAVNLSKMHLEKFGIFT